MGSVRDFETTAERLGGGSEFELSTYLNALRRRYLFLILPAVLIFTVVFWIARLLPPVFQAQATILVESQQIPTDLAQSTVTANVDERIQLIQQRLMTRDNLLAIARKYGLFTEQASLTTDIVDLMRESTQIQQINEVESRSARGNSQTLGFTVAFRYRDPVAASNVANEFVTSILQQNIESRTARAAETSKFFEQQVARLEKELAVQDSLIVEFKNKNQSALPETLVYRRTLLSGVETSIVEINRQIISANDPKMLIPEKEQIELLDRRIAERKRQLQFAKEERESLAPLVEKGVVPRNRVRDLDRTIAALEFEIEGLESDIVDKNGEAGRKFLIEQLTAEREELLRKRDALNASILQAPQIESELASLMRSYENLQLDYREAKAKMSEAAIGEQLEEDRQAERFEVIEQATVPSAPISPNRVMIVAAGSFSGIIVGIGLVMLLEMLDKTFRGATDFERRLGIRPLATIPYLRNVAEQRRKRFVVGSVVLFGVAASVLSLILVQVFYFPLDVVARRLLASIGL